MTESDIDPSTMSNQEALTWCAQPVVPSVDVSHIADVERARAIVRHSSKWVSGTTIRYHLFDELDPGWDLPPGARWIGNDEQSEVVRDAFAEWKSFGIGLDFQEVDAPSEAEVRIGFVSRDGSWSYVGTDVLAISSPSQRTMSFGWDLTTNHGRDTARHEIGHTLGMPHEHQNPNAGIVWDEAEVLRYFAGPPNSWPDDQTRHNILRKLNAAEVMGSEWDRDSIMHYAFPAGLITEPEELRNGLEPKPGISAHDIAWVQAWYPPFDEEDIAILEVNRSQPIQILPGHQAQYAIEPAATREYTIMTLGESDTRLTLFEEVHSGWRFRAGDDDGGENRNARIQVKLFAGRQYQLRTRLYHAGASGEFAVVMF
jgi:hypothetical protein